MSRFGTTQYGGDGVYYSTIKYGTSGLFAGEYISIPYTPDGPLISTASLDMDIAIGIAEVNNTDDEPEFNGTWSHDSGLTGPRNGTLSSTSEPGASVSITFIGKEITIGYSIGPSGGTAAYSVMTDEATPTEVTSGNIDMNNVSTEHAIETTIVLSSQLAGYTLTLTHSTDTIYFDYLDVLSTDIVAYASASEDLESWTEWAQITNTSITNNKYEGDTDNYYGMEHIRLKLDLLSSVYDVTPEVHQYQLFSTDIAAYAGQGTWQSNTITLTPNFGTLSHVTWNVTLPDGTYCYIQTSTYDGTNWGYWSHPYLASGNIIRLRDGEDTGTVITPYFEPTEINHATYIWMTGDIDGYLPGLDGVLGSFDSAIGTDMRLRYRLEDEAEEVLPGTANSTLGDTLNLEDIGHIHNNTIRIRATLLRTDNQPSPYILSHTFVTDVTYDQVIEVNAGTWDDARISSVMNENTGIRSIITPADVGFTVPTIADNVRYTFTDNTSHLAVVLSWASDNSETYDDTEEIIAVSTGDKHYAYISGTIYYGSPLSISMPASFTPSIPSSVNPYAYRLIRGWGEDEEASTPTTINDNENITVEWASGGEDYETDTMDTSATPLLYYPITEDSSDSVDIHSLTPATNTPQQWHSNTVLYTATVNTNYLIYREDYNVNVALPYIEPAAIIESDPYIIEILPTSFRCNGIPISDEAGIEVFTTNGATPTSNLTFAPIIEEDVLTQQSITRSSLDKDLLPHAHVQTIITISNSAGGASNYTEGIDFALDNNHIDWSIGGIEPAEGQTYYVTYEYNAVDDANIQAFSEDTQEIWTHSYWKSDVQLKNYDQGSAASCLPTDDFMSTILPAINNTTVWNDQPDNLVDETIRYYVFNNNQLVMTTIEEHTSDDATPVQGHIVRGTLGGRRPSRFWNPRIHDGFYYLSRDEYYLYIEPATFTVPDDGTIDAITNTLEVPYTPLRTSPIIVTALSDDATPEEISLRQVGFTIEADNTYVTYLTEPITLDGTQHIQLTYDNIDPEFSITILMPDGTTKPYLDIDPTDNLITMAQYDGSATPTLEPLDPSEAYNLAGTVVYVTYQPKDCFVIDYNTLSGSAVRFTFSQHYDDLEIHYESTHNYASHLATELDINPIRTSLNKGFVYVAQDNEPAKHVYIRANPEYLVADGRSRSVIVIDLVDRYNNPAIDSNITVSLSPNTGTLTPYADNTETPSLKQMSGRHIYTYTAPDNITTSPLQVRIIATDDNGLSRYYPLTLVGEA